MVILRGIGLKVLHNAGTKANRKAASRVVKRAQS